MKKFSSFTVIAIALFTTALFSACDRPEKPVDMPNAMAIKMNVAFRVTDKEGNDLLDPSNPNAYNHENIKLWIYEPILDENGEVIDFKYDYLYGEGTLDNPRMLSVLSSEGQPYVIIVDFYGFLDRNANTNMRGGYIDWKGDGTDIDTISAEVVYRHSGNQDSLATGGSALYWEKVYYNNKLLITYEESQDMDNPDKSVPVVVK